MNYFNIFYVIASILFILGIKNLSHPKTARRGNFIAAMGMLIAIIVTLLAYGQLDYKLIIIGIVIGSIIGTFLRLKLK